MACEDCCGPRDLSGTTRGYRRALVIVIVLNLGMGVVEMAGGFLGLSQALKADALDFLGDGLITLLGFIALHLTPVWRSKVALAQGVFLAVLGLGVLGAAAYRAFMNVLPDAGVMGVLGVFALMTNLAAMAVLMPHRRGDAHVRAVWLFSRSDAIGNMAVIAAGALVAWTGTLWPDLIAAVAIASLFLASAAEIIRSAGQELSEHRLARQDSVVSQTAAGHPPPPAESP